MSTTINPIGLQEVLNRYNHAPKGSVMSRMSSPLDEEFKDGDYAAIQGLINYVPFLDCGDATWRVMRNMTQLSPTHGACISLKMDYALSGGLGLKSAGDKIMRQNNRERPISDSEHDEYADFVESYIGIDSIMAQMRKIAFNREGYGNTITEIILTQTAGVRGGSINTYDASMFRYKREGEKINHTRGYLSQRWDFGYILRNRNYIKEYAVSRINPNNGALEVRFSEHEDGTLRTLLHLFEPALDRSSYGLPLSITSIYSQYLEFQMGKYHTRAYQNQLLPSLIIESYNMPHGEEDAERAADEIRQFMTAFQNSYTNKGDGEKMPLMLRNLPAGTAPSTFFPLSPPTQEGFYKVMSETTAAAILKSHNVNKMLLERTAGSIGASTELSQAAGLFDKTVIRPLQEAILLPIRIGIAEIAKWVGYQNRANLMLDLKTAFEKEAAPMSAVPADFNPTNAPV
jgi:hypothetical protein